MQRKFSSSARVSIACVIIASLAILAARITAQHDGADKMMKGAVLILAADVKWQEPPPSLPKGAKVAVLEGDPSKDGPFVMRVKMPDGYKVLPHTHPKRERLTVLSGVLNIGMGEKYDEKAGKPMPVGTFGSWPEGMAHFGWTTGETIIQLNGMGPWSIRYIDPKDDPRNK